MGYPGNLESGARKPKGQGGSGYQNVEGEEVTLKGAVTFR